MAGAAMGGRGPAGGPRENAPSWDMVKHLDHNLKIAELFQNWDGQAVDKYILFSKSGCVSINKNNQEDDYVCVPIFSVHLLPTKRITKKIPTKMVSQKHVRKWNLPSNLV